MRGEVVGGGGAGAGVDGSIHAGGEEASGRDSGLAAKGEVEYLTCGADGRETIAGVDGEVLGL